MRIYEGKLVFKLVQEGLAEIMDSPERVFQYMLDAFDFNPVQESMWVIALDRKNHAIGRTMISLGVLTGTLIEPREIFRIAILSNSSAIILVHNHPSGDPSPSSADIRVTRKVRQASEIMGIDLVDHVIVGNPADDRSMSGYYSFADNGLI